MNDIQSQHRALVVGTGFGCRIQLPALRDAGFEVVGLVGSDPARTKGRAAANLVPQSFTDLDRAIAETGASVVAIAAPPGQHCELALRALALGCHVVCEKPFAGNASEANQMLEAAVRADRVHLVGHEFRFVPQRATIARAVAEGRIGQPRFFSLIGFNGYVDSFAQDMPAWWFDPGEGGGWLGASGSHLVDQIRTEAGEISSVSAILSAVSAASGRVEDSFVVRFQLKNGGVGVMQQTSGGLGTPDDLYRIVGDEGTIWTYGNDVWFGDRAGSNILQIPDDLVLPLSTATLHDPRHASVEWQFLTAIELAPYTRLCLALKSKIEGKSWNGVSPATFQDGLACMKVIDAIRESAQNDGKEIAISQLSPH